MSDRATQNDTPPKRRSSPWKRAFLATLAETGNVSFAAKAAKIERKTAYRAKENHPTFAAAWADAMEDAGEVLLAEARRRAVEGLAKPVTYQGKVVEISVNAQGEIVPTGTDGAKVVPFVLREYSDGLLLALLKASRPEFRESYRHEHSGPDGKPIPHEHKLSDSERAAIVAALMARYGGGDTRPGPDQPGEPGGPPVGGPVPADDLGGPDAGRVAGGSDAE